MMSVLLRCIRPLLGTILGAMALLTAPLVPAFSNPSQAGTWPSRVQAVYGISYAGLNLGTFEFNSVVTGSGYHLTGRAQLSALLGAFEWKSDIRTHGVLSAGTPRPTGYSFDFRSNSKSGQVKMSFADNKVASVLTQPPMPSPAGTVPVTDAHLQDVLDPLSAIMVLAGAQGRRISGANPCGRRLAIFDGKQRFDLVLSYKSQSRVAEAQPSGQPNMAYVCRVRYVPIAGYKPNEEIKTMTQETGIEVWLRPVPSADLFVPYQVVIPTGMGQVTLTSQKVEITTQSQGQIAFVY